MTTLRCTKDFFSKCEQIRRKLRICSHLLKKSLMENFMFCAVVPNKRGGGGGQNKRSGRRILLNLIDGGVKINRGVKISKNPLISVMNEKTDINV